MAFAQAIANGTAVGANVSSYALTYAQPNGRSGLARDPRFGGALPAWNGICLIADIMWEVAGTTASTIAVTDTAGNTWTQVFANTNPGIGPTGLAQVENWSTWICIGAALAATTLTLNTVTATCSATMAQVTMAISEHNNISGFDTYAAGFGPLSNAIIMTGTTSESIETLHTFLASSYAEDYTQYFGPNSLTGWFYQRRVLSPNSYIGMKTADIQLSAAGPFSTVWGSSSHVLQPTAFAGVIALIGLTNPLSPATTAWLQIQEPYIGLTDRTSYLYFGQGRAKHQINSILRGRGTADIPLIIRAGDTYTPTQGTQVFLYDQAPPTGRFTSPVPTLVFAGSIEKIEAEWIGFNGDQIVTLNCVDFKKCFDTLLVPPQAFYYQTVGEIFTILMQTVANGVPVKLGTVNATFTMTSLKCNWDRLSDVFDSMAQAAGCVWDIDLTTLEVYIRPPTTNPAPYTLAPRQIEYGTCTWEQNSQDYRNRQILRISGDAFAQSSELFQVSSLPQSFQLLRAADTITNAWLTKNRQNFATGTFTGQPSPGDTIMIGYPSSGSIYNWAANAPYRTGQIIIDPLNNVQLCTTQGTSGSAPPSWNATLGGFTTDGPGSHIQPGFNGAVIWTNKGVSGAGGVGAAIYTFVAGAVDNTQWGQVLIGPDVTTTCFNLVLAINADQLQVPQHAGNIFSWPTWENELVNAEFGSSQIVVRNKPAGQGYIAALSKSCANFSWSSGSTTGGSTVSGTYTLQVAQLGSSNTANLYYQPGTGSVGMASLPSGLSSISGYYLQVQYTRLSGDCIVVENSGEVLYRGGLEGGTGKYEQIASATDVTSNTQGLLYAQALLQSYCTIPLSFSFLTWRPGISVGQILTISLSGRAPANLQALVNSSGSLGWIVQEVSVELMPSRPFMDQAVAPNCGHYKYTVTVINQSQVISYLGFWEQMASGGGGGSLSGAVVGAPAIVAAAPIPPSGATSTTGGGTVTGPQTWFDVPVISGIAYPDASQKYNRLTLTAANTVADVNGNFMVSIAQPANFSTVTGNVLFWTLKVLQDPLGGTGGYSAVADPDTYVLGSVVFGSPAAQTNTFDLADMETDSDGNTTLA